jgi:hypothetical protein
MFWVKILKFIDADPGPGWKKFGSGIGTESGKEKVRIRDEHPESATLLPLLMDSLGNR